MDMLPETLNLWILNYGVIALFVLLALGIVAFPVPEETLLVFSGVLISQGTFALIPTVLAAFLGSVTGITGSYVIGSTGGHYVIAKYGKYVGLHEEKMIKVHNWFEIYGKWVLFIGYFVPGVRHFTGVIAGVSELEYRHFALYAYMGALFWVSLFISVGYFFGGYYKVAFELIESNVEIVCLLALLLVGAIIGFKYFRATKKNGNSVEEK